MATPRSLTWPSLRPQVNGDDDDSPGCLVAHKVRVTVPPTNKATGDCLISCRVCRGVVHKVLSKYNSVYSAFSLTVAEKASTPSAPEGVAPTRSLRPRGGPFRVDSAPRAHQLQGLSLGGLCVSLSHRWEPHARQG